MSEPIVLESLDLAALVASKVCHDVISPVGALVNAIEVLDEGDESMKTFALDLIRKSATQASARLQFCRIAFGAAGSAGAEIDTGDAEKVTRGMVEDERTTIVWDMPRQFTPKNRVKLLLNLVLLATNAMPRGGTLTVRAENEGFAVRAEGNHVRIAAGIAELIEGIPESGQVNAHAIQPFYTGLLARAAGLPVTVAMDGEAALFTAKPAA